MGEIISLNCCKWLQINRLFFRLLLAERNDPADQVDCGAGADRHRQRGQVRAPSPDSEPRPTQNRKRPRTLRPDRIPICGFLLCESRTGPGHLAGHSVANGHRGGGLQPGNGVSNHEIHSIGQTHFRGAARWKRENLPGRAGGCPPAPPQSRTSPIEAYGSSAHGLAL